MRPVSQRAARNAVMFLGHAPMMSGRRPPSHAVNHSQSPITTIQEMLTTNLIEQAATSQRSRSIIPTTLRDLRLHDLRTPYRRRKGQGGRASPVLFRSVHGCL